MDTNYPVNSTLVEMTDQEIDDYELVVRAVHNGRARYSPPRTLHPRWLAVKDVFGITRDQAFALCAKHEVDPNEILVS